MSRRHGPAALARRRWDPGARPRSGDRPPRWPARRRAGAARPPSRRRGPSRLSRGAHARPRARARPRAWSPLPVPRRRRGRGLPGPPPRRRAVTARSPGPRPPACRRASARRGRSRDPPPRPGGGQAAPGAREPLRASTRPGPIVRPPRGGCPLPYPPPNAPPRARRPPPPPPPPPPPAPCVPRPGPHPARRAGSRPRRPALARRPSVARASAWRRRAVSASAARADSARRSAASSSPRARDAARSEPSSVSASESDRSASPSAASSSGSRSGTGSARMRRCSRHVGVGGRALVRDPLSIPHRGGDLARRPRLAQPQRREVGTRGFVHHPALALLLRALRHRGRDAGDRRLRRLERLERPLRLQAQGVPAPLRLGRTTGGLVPASVRGGDQRRRQLLARREPGRLLLGQLAEAPRLRAELREDVLDAREVRLGLGELILGLPASALVAPDPGDLLEQRPALLGAQRERLVHHALPDEQERVLGDVRRVQQVLEVAQADPLPVEQVVVLAGPVEAPAELHHGVLDREQRVTVLEDEGHVGHALGAAPLGARPDHVLALPDPQRATLLAQRPPEGVGQVGLPRPVGAHDRADAGPELDEGPLREGLEPLDTQAQEAGRRAHEPLVVSGAGTPAAACHRGGGPGRHGPPAVRPAAPRAPPRRPTSRRCAGTDPRPRPAPGRPRRPRCGTASRDRGRPPRAAGTAADRPSSAGCAPGAGSWGS